MKKPAQKVIIAALHNNYGVVTDAARELGVVRSTLHTWINSNKKLQEEYKDAQNSLEDLCKNNLVKNIKAGKEASIFFCLKARFHWKEAQDPLIQLNNNQVKITYIEPTDTPKIEEQSTTINIDPKNNEDD